MKIPRSYIQENLQDFLKDGEPIMDLFLYYDDNRAAKERQSFNDYVTSVKLALEQRVEYTDKLVKDAGKYLIVLPTPSGKREFTIIRNEDAIQKVQDMKGFFIVASNADETPENEIVFVRKRDKSEKSYRRRKTFFQLATPGTGTNETYGGKMNIADISQNIEEAIEYYGKPFTSAKTSEAVSTMIAELHKIKFYIELDGKIRLAYPLTKQQKDILALFDLTEEDVIEYVKTLEWGKPYSKIYNAKEKKEIRKAEIKAKKAQEKAARKASRVAKAKANGKS